MRRGRVLILIALLLVLTAAGIFVAFVLSGGNLFNFNRAVATSAPREPTVPAVPTPETVLNILAASQNLPRGVVIPTEALMAIPWPTNIVPQLAITNPASIVGTRARYTINRGEPIF